MGRTTTTEIVILMDVGVCFVTRSATAPIFVDDFTSAARELAWFR